MGVTLHRTFIQTKDVVGEERRKYDEIWSMEEYRRAMSPGLENVDRLMGVLKPAPGSTVLDAGCGSGGAGVEFGRRGLKPYWQDISDAGLLPEVDRRRFFRIPLWERPNYGGLMVNVDVTFCCDVLEHIPVEYTMLCVHQMLTGCGTLWVQVAHLPDKFGPELLGQPLHLTVADFNWWKFRLSTVGELLDARDLCGVGLFIMRGQS